MTPANRRVPRASTSFETDGHAGRRSGALEASWRAITSGLRTLAGIALVASASIGVAWTARRHVLMTHRFDIARIEVAGCERRTPDAIIAESGLALGTNAFAADLDGARARLLGDPWIADASLVRHLPGTIRVHVSERKTAALVVLGDVFLVSAAGEAFKPFEPGDPIDLPVITGLSPESVADDREGAAETIRRALDVAAEFEGTGLSKRAPLEEVHVGPDGAYTLVVGRTGLQLVLGGPPFRRKLEQATRVVAELDRRGGKAEAIMLDNDARPERVVVRVR